MTWINDDSDKGGFGGTGIELAASAGLFFKEEVEVALTEIEEEVTGEAVSYVCHLLSGHVGRGGPDDEALDRSLTLMLSEALEAPGAERVERLRGVGDGVLFLSGFFGEHLHRRGVTLDYVGELGARAYEGAAELLRRRAGVSGVYRELASKFDVFTELLTVVAQRLRARGVRDDRSRLQLYERWMRQGQTERAQGLLLRGWPPPGRGGMN